MAPDLSVGALMNHIIEFGSPGAKGQKAWLKKSSACASAKPRQDFGNSGEI